MSSQEAAQEGRAHAFHTCTLSELFFAQQSELFALFEQKEESTCHRSHLCICATIVLLCVQKIALRKKIIFMPYLVFVQILLEQR